MIEQGTRVVRAEAPPFDALPEPMAQASIRPEHLGEEEYAAIWALVARGRLRPETANHPWEPPRRVRGRLLSHLVAGVVMWAAVAVGAVALLA